MRDSIGKLELRETETRGQGDKRATANSKSDRVMKKERLKTHRERSG